MNITLKATKSFLGYLSVTLLGQKVNGLGLMTSAEKLEAISSIKFPATLWDLEIYLRLTGYMRNYVPLYSLIAHSLQETKTHLLKDAPDHSKERLAFTQKSIINLTSDEIEAFEAIQEYFHQETMLVHFDPARCFYIDLDTSGLRFGVVAYHLWGETRTEKTCIADIQPILFLSRLLNTTEKNYWLTELKVACLVWSVKKLRHYIESVSKTVVFTDHRATPGIASQTMLQSVNSDKLNKRLIWASQYLSQFDMEVCHKLSRTNIVPDTLLRLASKFKWGIREKGALEELLMYNYTLVKLADDFKAQLKEAYQKDKQWNRVLWILGACEDVQDMDHESEHQVPRIDFCIEGDLIYHVSLSGKQRLCIPKDLKQEIFQLAHDKHSHSGFYWTYEHIAEALYIQHLSRQLKKYIKHCQVCQVFQTKRHWLYGELKPLQNPRIPFHTIMINFILGLPTDGVFNCALTVTDKFSKAVTILPRKESDSAEDWARILLTGLSDWGILRSIVSDWDPKFLSDLWQGLFWALGTKLLVSTAYHPQSDRQSEWMNQTVKIAMRYYLRNKPTASWVEFLLTLRSKLNNLVSASTGKALNQVIYRFKTNDLIIMMGKPSGTDVEKERTLTRREAEDSILFAGIYMKATYDWTHQPLQFKLGDKVFLKLHKGYNVLGEKWKLGQQWAGPLLVKEKVGKLAYRLQLPDAWKVHDVISVANLEPAPKGEDPFSRPRINKTAPVENENADFLSYKVERLVDWRIRRYSRGLPTTEYWAKWKG